MEVEEKKDISATLLKLYLKKFIDFEDDRIVINQNIDRSNLKESEIVLLESIADGKLNITDKIYWKNICINEAIYDGYLQRTSVKQKKHFWGSTFVFLIGIALIVHSFVFFASVDYDKYSDVLDEISNRSESLGIEYFGNEYNSLSEQEIINKFSNQPELLKIYAKNLTYGILNAKPIFIAILEFIFGFIIISTVPIYKIFRKITYRSIVMQNNLGRTKKGKILAEQIGAMQNYIHDFSLLSEKDKEQVKLWDEFLIYAVVLEENDQIIDEIFNFKGLKKSLFC